MLLIKKGGKGIERKFTIEFFKSASGKMPVLDYLNDLRIAKPITFKVVAEYIDALEKGGSQVGMPKVRYLHDGIWELRPKDTRILYCCIKNNKIYFLHAFTKKSNKTPKKELDLAIKRYKLLVRSL